jgi:D-3-phosphoglycerate dehydrogenase
MGTFKIVMPLNHTAGDEAECRKIGGKLHTIICNTEEELITATRDADAIMTSTECHPPFTRKVISELSRCKVIHNIGAGYEKLDVPAATDYGICVSFAGDYCAEEVAEHTLALLLACARRVVRLDRAVREGNWGMAAKREMTEVWSPMFRIKGQTLGIIGFGRVGRLVASKASGFGLRVIASDPYVTPERFRELGVEPVTLDDLLSESDFVSINAALSKDNRHLLGREQFQKMKPSAYFINCARAEFTDEEALCRALANGDIAGAGLDLVAEEAVTLGHPFLKLENVVLTAHSAWYSETAIADMKRRVYENIGRVLQGEWPTLFVNPEVKEKFLARWGEHSLAERIVR